MQDFDLVRVKSAVEYSMKRLEAFRTGRLHIVKNLAGDRYAEGGNKQKLLPFLRMAATIHTRKLVPTDPAFIISTKHLELKQIARYAEVSLNDTIKAMNFGDILRRATLDAWIGFGVLKVGIDLHQAVPWNGANHQVGRAYVELVDPEDYVVDMTVKRRDLRAFEGHRFRMPVRVARDLYDKDIRPSEPMGTNFGGDERISQISNPSSPFEGEIEDMVDCWELFFPRDRIVATLRAEDNGGISTEVLQVSNWKGPVDGPYIVLGFLDVPGQIMPAGPGQDLIGLHEDMSGLYRKLRLQAGRQKTNTIYRPHANEDAETWKNAADGDAIANRTPEDIQEISRGGPNRDNFLYLMQLKALFGELGGNLGALGGLGPQAETLGQDKMIEQNSSTLIQEAQSRVLRFAREVGRSLFFWWYTDPVQEYLSEQPIPDTSFHYRAKLKPGARIGNIERLNFDIDPYSLQSQTPQAKLQAIMQFVQGLLLPAAPLMQQQQVMPNWEGIFRLIAKYANMADMDQVVQFATAPAQMDGPYMNGAPTHAESVPMSPVTNRTYTRVNRPGMTQQGSDQMMMQHLMSQPNSQNNNGQSPFQMGMG